MYGHGTEGHDLVMGFSRLMIGLGDLKSLFQPKYTENQTLDPTKSMKSLLSDALVFMLSPNNSFALVQHSARDALSVPESAGAPGNQQHRAFILRQARHWAWQHQC